MSARSYLLVLGSPRDTPPAVLCDPVCFAGVVSLLVVFCSAPFRPLPFPSLSTPPFPPHPLPPLIQHDAHGPYSPLSTHLAHLPHPPGPPTPPTLATQRAALLLAAGAGRLLPGRSGRPALRILDLGLIYFIILILTICHVFLSMVLPHARRVVCPARCSIIGVHLAAPNRPAQRRAHGASSLVLRL